ncbi:TIGR02757 family protein [Aquirufa sp. HETE-40SA]
MNSLSKTELKEFLDYKVNEFNRPEFIELDPISIPHQFSLKEDIEIAAFLTATISWGNRKAILGAANQMIQIMGESPYDFIMNCDDYKSDQISKFYYRTFNGIDFSYFLESIRNIYVNHGGLESVFNELTASYTIQESISEFKNIFFELPHPKRTQKHVSDPRTGSASKRINMMLRWLIRKDNKGVDFGLWKEISPSKLSIPLDVHSGNTARKLGLLQRDQNDAKAVVDLDSILREFEPIDPVKYDFALFGLGVIEKF